MANRVFYATQAVGFANDGAITYTAAKGVQNIGMTTSVNLEQAFELGQISIYENIEAVPEIEITMQKLMDGTCPLFCFATRGANAPSLAARAVRKCTLAMSIYDDTQSSASGTPIAQVTCSGLFVSNVTYTFDVGSSFTEDVTLVGNNKVWITGAYVFTPTFTNTDLPISIGASGGINRREDMLFGYVGGALDINNQVQDPNSTILPPLIPGISASGTNQRGGDGLSRACHIQNITVSCDLGRDEMYEMGHKTPYFRYAQFPVEIDTSVTTLTSISDLVSMTDQGVLANGDNLSNNSIRIAVREGLRIDLGKSNKLSSVSYGGGDTGGGNVSTTFNFVTFNDFQVTHWNDITPGLAGSNTGFQN